MDKKMDKHEFQAWARTFFDMMGRGNISFSTTDFEALTVQQLCDRLRLVDAKFADKVATWHAAASDLGQYVAERMGENVSRNPDAYKEKNGGL